MKKKQQNDVFFKKEEKKMAKSLRKFRINSKEKFVVGKNKKKLELKKSRKNEE